MKKVFSNKAFQIIKDESLFLYKKIWHYSYNFTDFEWIYSKQGSEKLLFIENNNNFAPTLIYTNLNNKSKVKINNSISDVYDKHDFNNRRVFWFLKISSFEDFLKRRSSSSKKPRKHFPTTESFYKIEKKINAEFIVSELNTEFFCKNYDALRNKDYFTGNEIINDLYKRYNSLLPSDWLKVAYLKKDNKVIAISLIVDDGKSVSLENITSVRSSLSYGVYLCTMLIKYCVSKNYSSFDAGVSGVYGVYKNKIFLDSFEIYKSNSFFMYLKLKLKKMIKY